MLHDPYPRNTLVRTRGRLDRHGATRWVIVLNAFEWISLSLHHALWPIIGATLALAIASRVELGFLKGLLLLPLAYLLLIRPLVGGVRTTRRQLQLQRRAARVWGE